MYQTNISRVTYPETAQHVSIITAFKNSKRFIPDYINMLLRQTHLSWVCFLIDDNSSDGSFSEARLLTRSDPRFCLISLPFRTSPGPSEARNYALSLVTTELVAFCDIDDLWHPRKLELQLAYHTKNALDISVTCFSRFVDKSSLQRLYQVKPPASITRSSILSRNPIPMSSVLIRKEFLAHSFQRCPHEDYLYWILLFRSHQTIKYGCLLHTLMFYRIHDSNLSRNKLLMPFWTYAVFRRSGLPPFFALIQLFLWTCTHVTISIARLSDRPRITSVDLQMAENPVLLE